MAQDVEILRGFLSRGAPGPHYYVVLLGLHTYDLPDLLRSVRRGFAFGVLDRLQRNVDIDVDELSDLVQISQRTLARRRKEGRFLPEESDRLVRASRLLAKAIDLFQGDTESARTWLASRQIAAGGE